MIEVQLLIPTTDNAGVMFDATTDQAFETELGTLFGGFSQLPGTVAGVWVNKGTVYRDTHRVYAVFIDGLFKDGAKVMAATSAAKRLYGQLAVTVRYQGQAEIL